MKFFKGKKLLLIVFVVLFFSGCFVTPLVMIGNNQKVTIYDNDTPITEGNNAAIDPAGVAEMIP